MEPIKVKFTLDGKTTYTGEIKDAGVGSIVQNITLPTCPECESTDLVQAGKCTTCYTCGWSMCSL